MSPFFGAASLSALQQRSGWQPDFLSLLLGVILGVGLTLLFYRLLPRLRALRDQSVSRVQETQAWVRAGVEKRFQVESGDYVERYHLGRRWATLEEIFVPPLILDQAPPADPEATERLAVADLIYLWPELAAGIGLPPPAALSLRRLLLNGKRVVLSAPAGAGKTTLLAYCAHLCAHATDSGPYTFLLPIMPVLVHLAELELKPEEEPETSLADALQRRAGPLTAAGVGKLLREKLAAGQVLLLLDGWDELAAEARAAPAGWLERLLDKYPDIQVIVAAGTGGYGPLRQLDFLTRGLLPWRAQQALSLGEKWTAVAERSQPPRLDRIWHGGEGPLDTSHHLWLQLWGNAAAIEQGEPAVMEAVLELLLPAGDDETWLPTAARELWQRLAHRLLSEKLISVPPTIVQEHIAATLVAHGIEGKNSILRQTLEASGLFKQWSNRRISMLSPRWRDFLAAAYLAGEASAQTIADNVRDPYWADAIRFYVARQGESGLAGWLLDARSVDPWRDDLFRAASWLSVTPEGNEWRRQTLIQLGQLVVNPNAPSPLRLRAVAALAQSGDSGVIALLRQLLQRSDVELRQAAVAALGRLNPDLSVPLLEQMLKDQDSRVRVATVHSLGWQNSPRGEKPLLTALIGQDEEMAHAAAVALAYNGGESWQILREAAEDEMARVRRIAAFGLGLLDEPWAVRQLEALERDDEWVVQSAASQQLEQVASRNQQSMWKRQQAGDLVWLVEWAAQRKRTVPAGDAAISILRDVLSNGTHTEDRVAAAESLLQVTLPQHERAAVESALRTAVQSDESGRVRAAAFRSLTLLRRMEKA